MPRAVAQADLWVLTLIMISLFRTDFQRFLWDSAQVFRAASKR